MKDGFLFIDKQADWTSRDVCNKASHILNIKKVGHTGTLDPFATGLLIVAFGNASKAIPFLEDMDKTYIAELTLGKKTNTADLTGEIIEEKPFDHVTKELIKETITKFLGEQEQVPPMTSAIHVNGQKLYELAHKGIEIDRKPRKITVHEISLISFVDDKIIFSAKVSKGTYLRTLGEDIANALGTVGYLSALRRVKIHNYSLQNSKVLPDIKEVDLIPIDVVLKDIMERICVEEPLITKIKNGVTLAKKDLPNFEKDTLIFVNKITDEPLAIYKTDGNMVKCVRGLWA